MGDIYIENWPVLAVRSTQYNHQLGAGLSAGRSRLDCVSVLEPARVVSASLGFLSQGTDFLKLHSAHKHGGVKLNSLGF